MTTATPMNGVERTLASGASVFIDTTDVPIRIRGVDGPAARIRLVGGDLESEFRIEATSDRLDIRPIRRWGFAWRRRVGPLEVELPHDARVDARTASASIQALDLASDVRARTTSGDVELAGVGGRVGVDVVSGGIRVHAPSCERLATNSVSGRIEAVVGRLASLEARSMSGAIRVLARFDGAGPFSIQSVSGDLTLGTDGARLTASTMSGGVGWEGGEEPDATIAGRQMIAIGGAGPAVSVRTVSGDIRLVPWSAVETAATASPGGEAAAPDDSAEATPETAASSAAPSPAAEPSTEDARLPVLRALARGEISVEETERLLEAIDAAEAAEAATDD